MSGLKLLMIALTLRDRLDLEKEAVALQARLLELAS
jgi:hypothetical protein